MRNKDKATVRRLLTHARYEVLPTATIEAKVVASVPTRRAGHDHGVAVHGARATVELAESLTAQGYDVVPHLAARMVSGRTELEELVARLARRHHQRVRAGR